MNIARDFDDDAREFGPDAIRAALDGSQWPWPPAMPFDEPTTASSAPAFRASEFTWRDPATIKRREFLYGFELRRKQVSAVIGVGAGGKTTFKVGRAICMATGHDFFGHRVWNGPHAVWLVNLEDEREEVEKTVHAFLKLWDLTPRDLGGRLFIDGADTGDMSRLKLATEDRQTGFRIQRPVVSAMVDALRDAHIDYLDIDPFVSSHAADENSNSSIDAITKEWLSVAREADCAISLAHHVRKPSGAEATAFDARGAVAMINAARSCLVLQKMTKEVAQELGVPECDRKRYVLIFDDKNNKAPAAGSAEWYEFVSVGLGNGDDTGPEDSIGALQRWQAPNMFGGATARQLLHIQQAIDADPEKARKHSASPNWVGKLIAYVLDMNPDSASDKAVITARLRTWLDTGALKSVTRKDNKGMDKEYVEVGAWAILG